MVKGLICHMKLLQILYGQILHKRCQRNGFVCQMCPYTRTVSRKNTKKHHGIRAYLPHRTYLLYNLMENVLGVKGHIYIIDYILIDRFVDLDIFNQKYMCLIIINTWTKVCFCILHF
jgi:hypothetical protein